MNTEAWVEDNLLEGKVEYRLSIRDIDDRLGIGVPNLGIKITANNHKELLDEIRKTFFPFLTNEQAEHLVSPNYKTEGEIRKTELENYIKDWDVDF